MKTKIKLLSMGLIVSQIILSSCKGPAGPIGLAGPQGNNGQNGAAGLNGTNGKDGQNSAQGQKGDKGDKGTANVYYSDWILVTMTSTTNKYVGNIYAPKIVQEIIEKGTILMYTKIDNSIYPLPFTTSIGNTIQPGFSPGNIKLFSNYDYSNLYRYILIPGENNISAGRKAALKNMSYEEIKALYNIKD